MSFISLKHALELTGVADKDELVRLAIEENGEISDTDLFMSVTELIKQAPYMHDAHVIQIRPSPRSTRSHIEKTKVTFVLDPGTVHPSGYHAYVFTMFDRDPDLSLLNKFRSVLDYAFEMDFPPDAGPEEA